MISNDLLKEKFLKKYLIDNFNDKPKSLLSTACVLDNPQKTNNKKLLYLDVKYLRGQSEGVYKNEGVEVINGDLVILVDGENSGEIFEIPCNGYMGSTFKKLKFSENVRKKYIMYFIALNKELLKGNKTGAAIPHLNKKLFANLELYIPSLEEQDIMISKIDLIFNMLERKEKNDQNYIKLKGVLKNKILDEAVKGLLIGNDLNLKPVEIEEINVDCPFDIPNNWKWTTLDYLCSKIGSGSTPLGGNVNYVSSGVPFLREQNIYNDGIRNIGLVFITEEMNEQKKGSEVHPNDLLLNITGGSIGRCAIVPKTIPVANVNQHVSILRFYNLDFVDYVHYVIISPYFQELINDKQVGQKAGLSASRIKKMHVPMPPIEQQRKIVYKINELFNLIDKL